MEVIGPQNVWVEVCDAGYELLTASFGEIVLCIWNF